MNKLEIWNTIKLDDTKMTLIKNNLIGFASKDNEK